jgi:hypothetical protein
MRITTHGITSKFYLAAFFMLCLSIEAPAFANDMCKHGTKSLQGDNNIVQGHGGIWSYMERNGMNDHSVIGMQIDGKLQRLIVGFETMCEEKKIPSMELFKSIENVISEARSVSNSSPDRTPTAKILESIKALNAHADELIQKNGY